MGFWEAVRGLKSDPEIHHLVDSDMIALSPVPSLTLTLLRTPTVRLERDADARWEQRVFKSHGG